MADKFIGYLRLLAGCEQRGCPICRCVEADGRRHLDSLMYEQVTDAVTRARLRATRGFCNWHTWMLLELHGAATGAAILYEDVLATVLRRLNRRRPRARRGWLSERLARVLPGRRARPEGPRRLGCPVCADAHQGETRYIDTALRSVGEAEFDQAYEKSDGFCLPHLLRIVEHGGRPGGADQLVARTLAKWEAVRQDLQRFVTKHDYRNTEPFSEAEAASRARVFEVIAGRPGLFGNDLPRGEPRGRRDPRNRKG
jgi:Family of unknown function (DUF6062)